MEGSAQYLPIVTLMVLAVIFGVISALVSRLLAPRRPTLAKYSPYECGIVPRKDPPERFPVRFYLVAMIFIIFDIEIIFLYPYAVANRRLSLFGLVEMFMFIGTVFVAYAYVWRRGGLDWD